MTERDIARAAASAHDAGHVMSPLRLYKRWLSPLLGPRCRFHPSCSDYARVAIARFGVIRGGWLALTRIAHCQPLCRSGFDPVPDAFSLWPEHARDRDRSAELPSDTLEKDPP